MANTYKKLNIQIVFAVKNRDAMLHKDWRGDLFKYMAGALNKRGHYSLAVNGYNDHVHLFFDYNGKELLEDLVREIKKSSNAYIKENKLTNKIFSWQRGYGAFSHGYREKGIVIEYIKNQENHHKRKSFRKEYMSLLQSYEIDFKEEYVFQFFD